MLMQICELAELVVLLDEATREAATAAGLTW